MPQLLSTPAAPILVPPLMTAAPAPLAASVVEAGVLASPIADKTVLPPTDPSLNHPAPSEATADALKHLAASIEGARLSGEDPAVVASRFYDRGAVEPAVAVAAAVTSPTSRYRLKLNNDGRTYWEQYGYSYAEERYGSTVGPLALVELERLGPRFKELIVDPGIVIRFQQFKSFVRNNHLSNADPWLVREKFSEALGSRIVYRALALTDKEYQEVIENGMKSPLALKQGNLDPADCAASLKSELLRKLVLAGDSPILSVAEWPDIAKAAASAFLYKFRRPLLGIFDPKRDDNRGVYLFTIKVPELDLIFAEARNPYNPMDTSLVGKPLIVHNPEGKSREHPYDRRVESMILYEIGPEEIVHSEQVVGRYSYTF